MPDDAPVVGVLVDFARELRAAGLAVGSGEILTYCAAMSSLDPTDLLDLYWAGRATLVTPSGTAPVGPGSVIYVPAGETHTFTDVTEDLALVVVFAPPYGSRS